MYAVTYQGGGYGLVTFYICNSSTGDMIPVHRIVSGNSATTQVFNTPNLPLMASVTNPSTASNIILRTSSGIIGIEGIPDRAVVVRNAFSNSKTLTTHVETNLFTLKNKDTVNSIPNTTPIRVLLLSVATDGGTSHVDFRLRRNANLTGTTTFTDIQTTNSCVAYNTAGTYTSGTGTVKFSVQLSRTDLKVVDLTALDLPIPFGETLTLTAVTTGNNAVCNASIKWMEFY